MGSIPSIGTSVARLAQIDGAMPGLRDTPPGCRFHPRCGKAFAPCRESQPQLQTVGNSQVACWLYDTKAGGTKAGDTAPGALDPAPQTPPPAERRADRAVAPDKDDRPLVEVRGLKQHFDVSPPWITRLLERSGRRVVHAVDGLDITIARGESFGLVGESGCGKSTVARAIVGLYEPTAGTIRYEGTDLSTQNDRARHQESQKKMQMIFQDPHASLNPRWRVRDIVAETLPETRRSAAGGLEDRVAELLRQVGLSPGDGRKYVHEFSGGQRQRISIARALGAEPAFLVCDEPTSALDVSVQAQILNLMVELQERMGLTYLFISHDLAVVHHIATKVGVMYLGRLVEWGATRNLFTAPKHPYTRMLLEAVPDLSKIGVARAAVAGEVPSPINPPAGCPFHPRCPLANERCRREVPALLETGGTQAACHAVEEGRTTG